MMKKLRPFLLLLAFFAIAQGAWAQAQPGNLPAEVKAEDATITKFGHATLSIRTRIVTNPLTRNTDTLHETVSVEWDTEAGTAKRRNMERGGYNPNGSGFYNEDYDWWLDICYYNYRYPSIDADGLPVLLTAMACMPDEDCDYVNNVIIGCHVTITSNSQCPSQYVDEGSSASDVSLLMNHAGSGLVFHSAQSDMPYYNLVILPDYEGYGVTRNRAHPYLYQDITARQVVDATRYGIALYKNSTTVSSIRHPFRSGWRSICVGYSQGGSVAMATHRFIEQNDLTDELQFAGSVCGDGPYDPIATLMYYVKQYDNNGSHNGKMSMPVVLPLILKGMCDSNPYMKNHKVSDYLKEEFLNSGILTWLTQKEKTTDDITSAWIGYYSGFHNWQEYLDESPSTGEKFLVLKLHQILTPEGLAFFQSLYDANSSTYTSTNGVPLPARRGIMYDLQYALASNNLTKGWTPQHAMFLYHSYDDSVVPEDNRESAGNSFGQWVIKLHASGAWQFDHVGTGTQFYLGTAEFAAIRQLAKAPVHQTIANAIAMKDDIFDGAHTLDPWDNPPTINNGLVYNYVSLNGENITAEYLIKDGKAYLGSGYNACISQYSEGKVVIPSTITVGNTTYPVKEVSATAFRYCTKITEVVVPENVTRIGNFAFKGCQSLLYVSLPSTLEAIGSGAFIDLPFLSRLDVLAEIPPTWEYNDVFAFHEVGIGDQATHTYDDIQLCVPQFQISAYGATRFSDEALGWTKPEGWADFSHIGIAADVDAEAYALYRNNTLTFYYDAHRSMHNGTTYHLNTGEVFPGWTDDSSETDPTHSDDAENHSSDIHKVMFSPSFANAHPVSTCKWFYNCTNLDTIIGWENLNTDLVTDMGYMFHNCSKLTDDDLDLSRFVTSNVESMAFMFQNCTSLEQPDLSQLNTRNCRAMHYMFDGCTGLTALDLSSFDTRNCTNFERMFRGCSNLESLDIASFDMRNTGTYLNEANLEEYYCGSMFYNCSSLKTMVIPVGIRDAGTMFYGCTSMENVYCYSHEPFPYWDLNQEAFAPNKATRFHVLASTFENWQSTYGTNSTWHETNRDRVTFVGDLGTIDTPIQLWAETDWVNLQYLTYLDQPIYAILMNDFTITTMLGTTEHPFVGIFDGNGHTLTIDYAFSTGGTSGDEAYNAPFRVIRNATIKSLLVDGNMSTTAERTYAGGVVGWCVDDAVASNTITDCHVSAHISGCFKYPGGIFGKSTSDHVSNTISGCLFDGSIAIDHNYYINNTTHAGAISCAALPARQTVTDCMERGHYENISDNNLIFCGRIENNTLATLTNCYHNTNGMRGDAKRAYRIYTNDDDSGRGLVLDFGTPTATYNASKITAYGTGMEENGTFYAGQGQSIGVAIYAPGYEFDRSLIGFVGAQSYSHDANFVNFTVVLAAHDVHVMVPVGPDGHLVFTTIILNDNATDNTLKLEPYIDGSYKVQLEGHRFAASSQWNTLCLPFDVYNTVGTPFQGATFKVLDTITFENKVAVFHFKNADDIRAENLYLVKMNQSAESPLFDYSTIKRSLPPGMKVEVGEGTYKGLSARGNFNHLDAGKLTEVENQYKALCLENNTLVEATASTELPAFNFVFEVLGMKTDTVCAIVLDIEYEDNIFTVLDDSFTDIDNIFCSSGNWNDNARWATGAAPTGTSKVLVEGHAVIPANYVATANEIIVDQGSITIADGGQLVHNNYNVRATVEKNIAAHNGNPASGWYFVAAPLWASIAPSEENGFLANEYDLYYYDEPTHYWRNYKASNDIAPGFDIVPLHGYLYANNTNDTLRMTGLLRPSNDPVTIYGLSAQSPVLTGFNLVGNPFACNATINRPAYVINGRNVVAYGAGTKTLAPCEGVMVQASNNYPNVTFTPHHSVGDAVPQVNQGSLQITLAEANTRGSESIDKAIVSFNEGDLLGKFIFNEELPKLYIPQDGKDYAIAFSDKHGEMPLNFKATKNGEYTLSINPEGVEVSYLHLMDNLTGADVDMMATPQYTFTAKTTDYASRFRLVFSADKEESDSTSSAAFAYINNGNIVINGADGPSTGSGASTLQVVDMTGRVVLSADATNRVSTSGMAPGVYVLRLINGDDVKTQKIVVH